MHLHIRPKGRSFSCQWDKETGKCDPIKNVFRTTRLDNELEQEIQTLTLDLTKAPNKDAQSQAYANFNQRIKLLTLKYLKEITNQMLFLNQTMAMQSEIMADDYPTSTKNSVLQGGYVSAYLLGI